MNKIRRTKWSDGWETIETVAVRRGWAVEIGYNSSEKTEFRWCAQYVGHGYYFKTKFEARAFCAGRGWCDSRSIYEERMMG